MLEFSDLLSKAGLAPKDVRLLRHQTRAPSGLTPYVLWRDRLEAFEDYQHIQTDANRAKLAAPYWACFVVPPAGGTLFAGMYAAAFASPAPTGWLDPLYNRPGAELTANGLDAYQLTRSSHLEEYVGRLWVEWGGGMRSWIQRADRQNKPIVELRRDFEEDAFPGFMHFIANISDIASLPAGWATALRGVRGVYLLTSANTKEQYVGSATGEGGFYARWLNYAADGHGGNIGLKSRDPSDYQVSILEVSGSATSPEEILAVEQLWKRKLQSREMGLNRN